MIDLLYSISYLVSLSGLIGWFYVSDQKKRSRLMSQLFLGGFMVYLVTLGMASGTLSYKLLILFRDLVVLGLVSQFFSFFKKNKIIFFGLLAVLYGLVGVKGLTVLQNTFPQPDINTSTPVPPDNDLSKNKEAENMIPLAADGELLIELKEGMSIDDLKAFLEKNNLTCRTAFQPLLTTRTELDNYLVLDIPENQLSALPDLEQQLYATGKVAWVEGNEVIQVEPQESKQQPSLIPEKFGLNDPGVEQLWSFEALKIDDFYKNIQSSNLRPARKAIIAILDTGIDSKHEDIAANYFSIKKKYDSDPQGHGTHCAGIAGAVSNNGLGIASLSQHNEFVQITSIPVLNRYGMGTQKSIIDGIIEAADNQVDVISMSLGGRSNPAKQRAYEKAIQYAHDAGCIVLVAAGNSNDNARFYAPANVKGVIAVSAVDENLQKAAFSNYVTDIEMAVAAPGVNIYSTFPNGAYKSLNGTSMATPFAAGLVGVLKSINPDLTPRQAYELLDNTGEATQSTAQTGKLIQPARTIGQL